jgi:hypothetical protein
MILPDLVLPSRANGNWQYSGIDCLEHCRDQQHFLAYGHHVDYAFNSRGFRDQEWPTDMDELRSAIWCVGDSFTVGIGQPIQHTWPYLLSKATGRRTVNVSMGGASNDWIFRRARDIQSTLSPTVVVMWSYTHRCELADADLDDEQRRVPVSRHSAQQDFQHWCDLVHELPNDVTQCVIPDFHGWDPKPHAWFQLMQQWNAVAGPDWPKCPTSLRELGALPLWIRNELQQVHRCLSRLEQLASQVAEDHSVEFPRRDVIYITEQLDWARDHHHFDILTAQWLVDRIVARWCDGTISRNDLHA